MKTRFPSLGFVLTMLVLVRVGWWVLSQESNSSELAKIACAETEMANFRTALKMFHVDTGVCPSTVQGLNALLQCPAGITNWHGPYLQPAEIPLDPWGLKYLYEYPCPGTANDCLIISRGPDGRLGGGDDITNRWTPNHH